MKLRPIIDTHCDVVIPYQELGSSFSTALENTQTSLPLLKKTGVKLIFAGYSYDDLLKNSDQQFSDLHEMIKKFPDDFELVLDFKNIDKIITGKKIGVILHIEGAAILDNDINKLESLYKEGLRSLGFTHNTKNSLGTGALVDDGNGLTEFGKQVIEKCNDLNIILDLAHLNEAGFYDVLKYSKQKSFVSHGNCFELTINPRNFKDNQLKELAQINSVIGVFFSGKYLKLDSNNDKPSIDDAVAHIKHMADVMGTDNISLGCDYGGITTGLPTGLENHTNVIDLLDKLKTHGFTEEDLDKIAYKNMIRYLKEYQNGETKR